MIHTTPDYIKEFTCIAGECSDTCCSGWQIVIDDEYLKKYKNPKSFPDIDMRRYVDFRERVFKQSKDRRCAFLRDDNLCKLCYEYGEISLCRTCHLYPRHIEEFENVRETTLSLSCPEVCRIVLNKTEPVQFISEEDDEYEEFDDFDNMLYSVLLDARDVMLDTLRDRSIPMDVRAGMVLGLSHDIDKRIGEGRLFSVSELLDYVKSQTARDASAARVDKYRADSEKSFEKMKSRFKKLFTLEPIGYDWINLYTESELILYEKGEPYYTEWSERFDEYTGKMPIPLDIVTENILIYFVFTYFCGAVYDGNVYGKGKLCVYSTYYIRELIKAAFIRNGGELTSEEIADITMRYSRELEHSDINLTRIEQF